MAQARTNGGKFAKKQTYKCPNCGNTEYIHVHDANGKPIKTQKRCTNCGHVLSV